MEELIFHIKKALDLYKTELSNEVVVNVNKAIDEKLKSFEQDAISNRLITTPELQKLLSLSKSSINLLKQAGMPYLKIRDNVRFKIGDVMQFLHQYEEGTKNAQLSDSKNITVKKFQKR